MATIRVNLLVVAVMCETTRLVLAAPPTDAPHKPTVEDVASALPDFVGRLLSVTILDPTGTNTTFPGKNVKVRLEGPLSPLDMVMVVYPGGALAGTFGEISGANSGVIEIPLEYTGQFKISALGNHGKGKLVASRDVILFIDPAAMSPPATVTNIHVEPREVVLMGRGSTQHLRVTADYSDGVERDVNDDGLGTIYEGISPFFLLGPNGTIVGKATGAGHVTVSNAGHSVTVNVTVRDGSQINNAPIAHAGDSYTVCDSRFVDLNGSKSYDLDEGLGDALTFAWDLDSDGEFDDAFGRTPRVQLIFPGRFWMLGLRMTDSEGLESTDYALVELGPGCAENQ